MELSAEKMDKLKAVELEILRCFIQACEGLGLRYYVLGGTLLGAVRHKGFIPWDDDIDLGMPREDYDIFVREGQAWFPEHIFLQTHHSESGYLNNYLKIRNSNTTFIETITRTHKINHGIFIDVFPLDVYTDDPRQVKAFSWKNRIYMERIREDLCRDEVPLKSKVLEFVLRARYPSAQTVLQKREDLFKSIPQGKYWANHCGAWGIREVIPAQWYGEGTTLEFEGIPVKAPKEYEKWLTQVYGNYMQLPPVEKRVTHHYTEVIDPENGYVRYMER